MKKIELVEIRQVNDALAEMVALFRVELRSYKGIASKPNVEDGREEMKEYLLAGFPDLMSLNPLYTRTHPDTSCENKNGLDNRLL